MEIAGYFFFRGGGSDWGGRISMVRDHLQTATIKTQKTHGREQTATQSTAKNTADSRPHQTMASASWGSLGPALSAEPKGLEGHSAFLEIVTVETTYIAQYQHTVLILLVSLESCFHTTNKMSEITMVRCIPLY